WTVSLSIDGLKHTVVQNEGERSAELAKLAAAIRRLCVDMAAGGVGTANLAEGLQKVGKRELAPETFSATVRYRVDNNDFTSKESWYFIVHGRTAWFGETYGKGGDKRRRLELTQKELDQVIQVLVRNEAWTLPPLWTHSPSYQIELKVLNRNNGPTNVPALN